jgi:hypothetical protein
MLLLAAASPSSAPTLAAASLDMMDDLLLQYACLFDTLTSLPPAHKHCHLICLSSGIEAVAVRPYRYAYTQKEEIEWQCAKMLRLGIIRPNELSFSGPVILVKKHDGSWRMCADYHGLNDKTIKDKFPIPMVEELLDELRGATFFTKLDSRLGYHQVWLHPSDIEKTTL